MYFSPEINLIPGSFHSGSGLDSLFITLRTSSIKYPFITGIPINSNDRSEKANPIKNLIVQSGSLNANLKESLISTIFVFFLNKFTLNVIIYHIAVKEWYFLLNKKKGDKKSSFPLSFS